MNHFSRRLKKTAPLILLGLLLDHSPVTNTAQALVGGPFDNNQYPGVNADGTYSATLTGKNLIGMVVFGVSSSSESNGRFSIFHEGFVHYGAASGSADLASRRIYASILGVATVTGNGNGAGIQETTGGSATAATTINGGQTLTVRSGAEGQFIARMKGYPQTIAFEGEGRLATTANNAVLTGQSTPGIVYTVTVSSPSNPATTTNEPGTVDVPLDGQVQTGAIRSETPFKVRGSRTSLQPFQVLNNYAAIPPITPSTSNSPTPTATATATPVATP